MIDLEQALLVALIKDQITTEEYWEEVLRELAVSIEVRGLSRY